MRLLLLCSHSAGERVKGLAAAPSQSRLPAIPFVASRYPQLIPSGRSGRARSCIHAGHALPAHPCASPWPSGNASANGCRTRVPLWFLC